MVGDSSEAGIRGATIAAPWIPAGRVNEIESALRSDRTIDIVTVGRRTGRRRVTEIWFSNLDGRIVICGTPSAEGPRGRRKPRDWLANLKVNPEFDFCFKESLRQCLRARAVPVVDPLDRRAVMSAAATEWYRRQGFAPDELVRHSPIVDVLFLAPYDYLNRAGAGQPNSE